MKLVFVCGTFFFISVFVQKDTSVDKLLTNPFNLQKFKKAKGPSNSGLADVQSYFFKPEIKGRYFYFFLFRSPQAFVYSGIENKKTLVRSGTGFQIVTYKPIGKYQDDYFDPSETLIEVEATYNDPDLPELAFIGLDTVSIKKLLGEKFIRKENYFLFAKDNYVLIFNVQNGVVKCLKYARLNKNFSQTEIPSRLIEMTCENRSVR